jgi:hypothetical protein
MNHIRKFSSYKSKKNGTKVVKESVLQVDDTYKVRVIVDVKKSFVNSYIKKVGDNTQKNLRDFYSDMDIVEELVKHVVETNMNVDTIPATILVGGSQTQPQAQMQGQPQAQMQAQPQAQMQAQPQAQVQTEPAQDFEEVQPQGQPQGQGQAQPQPQAQGQGQSQGQGQAQEEEEETGEEEELPG